MADVYHADVEEVLKRWFLEQDKYRGWYLLKNESGWDDKKKAHCGFPESGGGSDYLALGFGQTEFFEVKTDAYPTLSAKQKIFARNITNHGFKCWVFRQKGEQFYLVDAVEYGKSGLKAKSAALAYSVSVAPLF